MLKYFQIHKSKNYTIERIINFIWKFFYIPRIYFLNTQYSTNIYDNKYEKNSIYALI